MSADAAAARALTTTCCIVGGGPAGMMLGLLLARAGVDVVVLEKHADFLRDFRGDTIHPSTLAVMQELGLLDELLQRPHNKVSQAPGPDRRYASVTIGDFTFLPPERNFIAMMPQWDFLDLPRRSRPPPIPNFKLIMQADVGRSHRGAAAASPACVPRRRTVRSTCARLRPSAATGAPRRCATRRGCRSRTSVRRSTCSGCAFHASPAIRASAGASRPAASLRCSTAATISSSPTSFAKGDVERIKQAGLPAFRQMVAKALPFLADRVDELKSWDDIKLLTVRIDRLRTWYRPGLLCIGDAAHAMSPVGGVGINLAIQDAVATANLLWKPLKDGTLTELRSRPRAAPARRSRRASRSGCRCWRRSASCSPC